ncbi:pyrroline-5-carboxylate reductase [Aciduricibacillus chroicocephali]|uniref:Pyrroline-5-carboxylate reductase n=1 Tax=Aciduricibacillus chroicocephali TaxID=3054939 RepID=A0ABY9KV45_9BACI|nr:pyrroline-5-carboxylate reductase [Bacillaceae bacterium 44XB]
MFKKVAFIGAGSMAEAIIAGLAKDESLVKRENIVVTNKLNEDRLEELHHKYGITTLVGKAAVVRDADIIVLSMKPKDLAEAVEDIKNFVQEDQVIVSVIAGASCERIANLFGKKIPVIRTMPNTSAMIGYSATALSKGEYATEKQLQDAIALFETVGSAFVVKEDEMHAVTSISGSGPAYFYFMVEAMQEAAGKVGLRPEIAQDLIVQTIVGAGQMLKVTEEDAGVLRKNITSPGGTTQAALETLATENFQEAVIKCVESCYNRSREMGKENG